MTSGVLPTDARQATVHAMPLDELETEEREELVPHLLDVVVRCGWELGDDDDPTEPYRRW